MLLVLAIACLAGAVFLVGDVATQPARQRRASVARAASYGRVVLRAGDARSFRERAIVPLAGRVAKAVLRLSPRTTVEEVSRKLLTAGMSTPATTFLAVKGVAAVAGLVF